MGETTIRSRSSLGVPTSLDQSEEAVSSEMMKLLEDDGVIGVGRKTSLRRRETTTLRTVARLAGTRPLRRIGIDSPGP